MVLGVMLFNAGDLTKLANNLDYVACGTATKIPKPFPQLTTVAYTLLITATPLVLIVFSIITLVKAIMSGNIEDVTKAKGKLLKKVIIAVIIFLVAGLVQYVLNRVTTNDDDKNSMATCMKCFLYFNDKDCPKVEYGGITKPGTYHRTYSNQAQPVSTSNKSNNNNSNSNNADPSAASNSILYIGDSRTVGYCGFGNGMQLHANEKCFDGVAVAQGGMGYSWFSSTGISEAKKILSANSNKKYNIVIWLGTNDIGSSSSYAISSAQKYAKKIGELADGDFKNHKILIVPVTRVDDAKAKKNGYVITQANVTAFNDSLKSSTLINKNNIVYCSGMLTEDYVSNNSGDGLHYNNYSKVKTAIGACVISK
jgi:hypothetical protein